MQIEDKTLKALAMSLNFRQMRQELISSNIANAETPGYKSKSLDFEEALARAIDLDKQQSLQVSDERHFDVGGGGFNNLRPEVYEEDNGVLSEDGNTVDKEAEMSKMVQNEILFDASIELLKKKIGLMKYAIQTEK